MLSCVSKLCDIFVSIPILPSYYSLVWHRPQSRPQPGVDRTRAARSDAKTVCRSENVDGPAQETGRRQVKPSATLHILCQFLLSSFLWCVFIFLFCRARPLPFCVFHLGLIFHGCRGLYKRCSWKNQESEFRQPPDDGRLYCTGTAN